MMSRLEEFCIENPELAAADIVTLTKLLDEAVHWLEQECDLTKSEVVRVLEEEAEYDMDTYTPSV